MDLLTPSVILRLAEAARQERCGVAMGAEESSWAAAGTVPSTASSTASPASRRAQNWSERRICLFVSLLTFTRELAVN